MDSLNPFLNRWPGIQIIPVAQVLAFIFVTSARGNRVKVQRAPYIIIPMLILLLPSLVHSEEAQDEILKARKILVEARQAAEDIKDVNEKVKNRGNLLYTAVGDKVELLNEIAKAQARAGDRAESLTTFSKGHEIIKTIHNDFVKDRVLDSVATAQALSGDVQGSFQTVTLIEEKSRMFFPLIKIAEAQLTEGDRTAVTETLEKANRIAKDSKDNILIWILSIAQARAGDTKGALRTVEYVESREVYIPLSEIAKAQAKSGDINGALQTVEKVEGIYKYIPLKMIVEAMIEAGNVDEALKIGISLKYDNERAYCLPEIAVAQAKKGNRSGAEKTIQLAVLAGKNLKDDQIIASIANARAMAGDITEAFKSVDTIHTDSDKLHALNRMAINIAKSGDTTNSKAAVQNALSIISNMKDNSFKNRWLGTEVGIQLQIGDITGALQTAKAINDDSVRVALWEIATFQAKAGDIEGAFQTLQAYKKAADHSLDYQILSEIAMAQEKAGDRIASGKTFEKALQAVDASKDACCRDHALREIARMQTSAGDVESAFAWSRKENSPVVKASAFLGMAEGILDRNGVKELKTTKLFDRGIP